MDESQTQEITTSLVREFLSRRGFRSTLALFDQEHPRSETSISNRADLIQALKIEHLIKKNKESNAPLKSMLEIIIRNIMPECNGTNQSSSTLRNGQKGTSADLVLEDTLEGDTLAGEGKSGLFQSSRSDFSNLNFNNGITKSGLTPRSRGMSGPISSNVELSRDRRRQMKGPSGYSSGFSTSHKSNLDDQNSLRDGITKHSDLKKSSHLFPEDKLNRKDTLVSPSSSSRSNSSGSSPDPISDIVLEAGQRRRSTKRSTKMSTNSPVMDDGSYDVFQSSMNQRESDMKGKKSYHLSANREEADKPVSYSPSAASLKSSSSSRTQKTRTTAQSIRPKAGDMELGDIDDFEQDFANVELVPRVTVACNSLDVESTPIDVKTASDLKTLIFGGPSHSFSKEWSNQSFTFSNIPSLKYGIVQKKGGPCGVLASAQAIMLQHLLFSSETLPSREKLNPSQEERSLALANGLASILWKAGGGTKAIVTLSSGRSQYQSSMRLHSDKITETLILNTIKSKADVSSFIHQNLNQFEAEGGSGVVLLLYSAILSRGIRNVKRDMDDPGNTLIGMHGYCTQEMVNLLLTGKAASNVFNDNMELDTGEGHITVLKGVTSRGDVGLLSLFEHYKSCQVGTYLKTPKYPIWVVCSESHFSVLFSLKKALMNDWRAEKRFDLYYYDGLAKQDKEIRLSIDANRDQFDGEDRKEETLIPPLEHCIRTKWAGVYVDWNGTEPLL